MKRATTLGVSLLVSGLILVVAARLTVGRNINVCPCCGNSDPCCGVNCDTSKCLVCSNGTCVSNCTDPCYACVGGECKPKCDITKCLICEVGGTCSNFCQPCQICSNGVCYDPLPVTNCASVGYFSSGGAIASPSVACVGTPITFRVGASAVPGALDIITVAPDCTTNITGGSDTIVGYSYRWQLSTGGSGSGSSVTTNFSTPGTYTCTFTVTASNLLCQSFSANYTASATVVNIGSVSAACQNVGVGGTATLTANVQPSGMTTTWTLTSGAGTVIPQGDVTAEFVANSDDGSATVQACVSGTECCNSITLNIVGACPPEDEPEATPNQQSGTPSGWTCSCGNPDVFGCLFFESVTFCPLACYYASGNDWGLSTTCLDVNFSQQVCESASQNCADQGIATGVQEILGDTVTAFNQIENSVTVPFSCSVSTPSAALQAMATQIADAQLEVYDNAVALWGVDAQDPFPTTAMLDAYNNCVNGN